MMDYVGIHMTVIKVIFGMELFLAEWILCKELKKKEHFKIRLLSSILITLAILAVFPVPIQLKERGGAVYGIFMYTTFYLLTVAALKFCYRENIWTILFLSAAAYTIEHIASSCNSILNIFNAQVNWGQLPFTNLSIYQIITYVLSLVVIYTVCYFFVIKRLQFDGSFEFAKKTIIYMCLTVVLVDHGFILMYFERIKQSNSLDQIFIFAFNIVCCMFLLATQISVFEQSRNYRELVVIDKLWKQAKEQYKINKENIDAINMKCHDMKHLIHKFEQEHNSTELSDISKILDSYDIGIETGSEILNVILTEKAFYCQKNQIQFTCIVNGEILDFIEPTDIYVLFGNIVDNCMNAIKNIEDVQKKNIRIDVRREKEFALISTENHYEGNLHFIQGLPITTNEDKVHHGYGMKSIQNIVTKHNGQMSVIAEQGLFTLSILIPISYRQKKPKK